MQPEEGGLDGRAVGGALGGVGGLTLLVFLCWKGCKAFGAYKKKKGGPCQGAKVAGVVVVGGDAGSQPVTALQAEVAVHSPRLGGAGTAV